MTERGSAIVELMRQTLKSVDTLQPAERDLVYTMLVSDLRARRPESVSPLTLGPPTEPIKDPRVP